MFTWPETKREFKYFVEVILLWFSCFEISSIVSPRGASLRRLMIFL
jgi:hypothetical protein